MKLIMTCIMFLLCIILMVITEGAPVENITGTPYTEDNCTISNTEHKKNTESIQTGNTLIVETTTDVFRQSTDLSKEAKETTINEPRDSSDGSTKVTAMKDSNGNVVYANFSSEQNGYIETQHMITEVANEGSETVPGENPDRNSFPIRDAGSKTDSFQTDMVNTSDDIQTGMHDNSTVQMKKKIKNYPETNDPLQNNDHSMTDTAMENGTEDNANPAEEMMTIAMQSKDDKETISVVEPEENEKYNAHANQVGVSETKEEGGLGHVNSSNTITVKEDGLDVTEKSSIMPIKKGGSDLEGNSANMTIEENDMNHEDTSSDMPVRKVGLDPGNNSASMIIEEDGTNSKDNLSNTHINKNGSEPEEESASMIIEDDGMNSKDNSSKMPDKKDGSEPEEESAYMTTEEDFMNSKDNSTNILATMDSFDPKNESSDITVEDDGMNSKDNSSKIPYKKDGSEPEEESAYMTTEEDFMNSKDNSSNMLATMDGFDPKNELSDIIVEDDVMNSKDNSSNTPVKKDGLDLEDNSFNTTVEEGGSKYENSSSTGEKKILEIDESPTVMIKEENKDVAKTTSQKSKPLNRKQFYADMKNNVSVEIKAN